MQISHLGLDGIDPVEYANSGQPTKGNPQFKTKLRDVTYCFCNSRNMEHFHNNPEQYLPQLDGCCAFHYAVYGKRVRVTAQYSNVVGGRIYLYATPLYRFLGRFVPGLLARAQSKFRQIRSR